MVEHTKRIIGALGGIVVATVFLTGCHDESIRPSSPASTPSSPTSSSPPPATSPPPTSRKLLSIGTRGLPNAQTGYRYGTVLLASGGSTPYRWSVDSGELPAGVSLDGATGKITGTPTAAGTFKFAVRVADASSASAMLTLGLTVAAPSPGSASLSSAPGWHKIPATAVCGGGSENNAPFSDPDNFPKNLNAAYASYGFGFTTQCYSMMEDSNGGAYDTLRHRLIMYGGGHQHYWGNDVFSLELTLVNTSAPTAMFHLDHSANPLGCPSTGSGLVTQAIGSVCSYNSAGALSTVLGLPACTYAPGCTPSQPTTPGSVHTYNGAVYVPGYDQFVVFGGATAPNGNGSSDIWLLAMSSVLPSCAPGCDPNWTPLTGAYPNELNVGTMAAYDPNTRGVWIQNQSHLEWFNPADNTLTVKSDNGMGYHSTGVLDPLHKYFILIGPPSGSPAEGILYVNVSGSDFTIRRPATSGCDSLIGAANAQYMGAQWDPLGKRVVIYPNGGNVIWYLDPGTWTCTSEVYGANQGTDYPQNTPIVGGQSGTFGHFAYDPAFDVFVLCNDPYNDCWYWVPSR